jgi:hypothetical protein
MPQPLYPGKSPWNPVDRRLGGHQNQSGCSGEEKNSHPLLGLEPSIIQPIAQCYTTELSQFLLKLAMLTLLSRNILFAHFIMYHNDKISVKYGITAPRPKNAIPHFAGVQVVHTRTHLLLPFLSCNVKWCIQILGGCIHHCSMLQQEHHNIHVSKS